MINFKPKLNHHSIHATIAKCFSAVWPVNIDVPFNCVVDLDRFYVVSLPIRLLWSIFSRKDTQILKAENQKTLERLLTAQFLTLHKMLTCTKNSPKSYRKGKRKDRSIGQLWRVYRSCHSQQGKMRYKQYVAQRW